MGRKRGTLKSKRKKQTPANDENTSVHWLTPKVWNNRCENCGHPGSIAYRHIDQSCLCELCLEQLGITAKASKAWKRRMGDL